MGVTVVREPGAGERIGEAFSGSVQGLLKGLVEHKLKSMQQEKQSQEEYKTFRALTGDQGAQQGVGGGVTLPPTGIGAKTPDFGSIRPGQAVPMAKFFTDRIQKGRELSLRKNKPFLENAFNKSKGIEDKLAVVRDLKDLNKRAKSGLFGAFPTEEAQQFEALKAQLIPSGAKKAEIDAIEKQLPHLKKHSPAVREKLLDRYEKILEKDYLHGVAVNEIIGENGGFPPVDIEQQAKARLSQQSKKFQQERVLRPDIEPVKEDIERPAEISEERVAEPEAAEQEIPEPAKSPEDIPGMKDLPDIVKWSLLNRKSGAEEIARGGRAFAGKALEGAIGGVTSAAALPFNVAELVSGRDLKPGFIKSMEALPKKAVKKLGLDVTPRSDEEEVLGNIISDTAGILAPGGVLGSLGKGASLLGKGSSWLNKAAKVLKVAPSAAAKLSTVGNAADWITRKAGGTKTEGSLVKMGAMLAVPLAGARMAGKKVSSLADSVNKAIPEAMQTSSPSLIYQLSNLENKISKGTLPNSKELISQIENVFTKGSINVKKLWGLRQSLNKATQDGKFLKNIKDIWPNLSENIDSTLIGSLKKVPNLEGIASTFNEYKDLSNATAQTSRIREFIKENVKLRPQSVVAYSVMRSLGVTPALMAKVAAPIWAVGGEVELITKMALKSSAFRKTYGDLIKASIAGNVSEANKAARHFDTVVSKEEGKKK